MVWLDPLIIWAFRLLPPGNGAFLLGCTFWAIVAVLIGTVTALLVKILNRGWYRRQYEAMIRMHNISVDAVQHGDKEAYLAANREAMEAFGKYFFSQAGVFMVSLWPIPLILAWMDQRFRDSPLEILGLNIPYFISFLFIYIAVRLVLGPWLFKTAPYRYLDNWAEHRTGVVIRHFEDIGKE